MNEHIDMIAPLMGSIAGISGATTDDGIAAIVSLCVAVICGITTVVQTAIKAYKAIRRAWLEAKARKERDENNDDWLE